MNTKMPIYLFIGLLLFGIGFADAQGLPWKGHRTPFDFLFLNNIDKHQQSMLMPDEEIRGYLYIEFTGEIVNGYPVAEHKDCTMAEVNCSVGWQFRGVPGEATLVYRELGNHPIWLVEPEDIPQPGAFSHFHWRNERKGEPQTAERLELENSYDGYFLELTAKDTFLFEHGEPGDEKQVLIRPGIDTASHLNLVLSFPE